MSARRPLLNPLAAVALGLVVCLMATAPAGALSPLWTHDPYLLDALIEDPGDASEPAGHLLVSEVMTGGSSALDEFIEIYNPTDQPLPLEGLEVVYVTASGATISRRASWSTGAPHVPAGGHVLIAHETGIFAPIADALYGAGLAAAGGSIALRIIGAGSAIDAVGWGSAASSWMEGQAAPAPAAGSSLERLPGGSFGSWLDTGDNAADFVVRSVPEPQNSGSPLTPAAPLPSASAGPSPSQSPAPSPPTPTPVPTTSPTPAPSSPPAPLSIAAARSEPDGTTVTVAGFALTDSSFSEGGGYLADAEAGIAVLLTSGEFSRASSLVVTGKIEDRYHQRTIRAGDSGLAVIGSGEAPQPIEVATGAVGEPHEGRLVRVHGTVVGAPTSLVAGIAFDVSDGSGPIRILVAPATGIDTSSWTKGAELALVGVVGQRDSTGGGTAGYRIQPRDNDDIDAVLTPSPTPGATASPTQPGDPSPSPSGDPGTPLVTIATARSSASGTTVRVRGVVTAPSGLVGTGSAVMQDATGAILLRHSDEIGPFGRGELVEVVGTRSTLSGMLSLRVTRPALRLGNQSEPSAAPLASGALGESHEARLVVVRGAVSTAPRRSTANNVFFSIDDGSGAAAVAVMARSQISVEGLMRGAWVEIQGILGQETTGSQPDRGYRIWPRDDADVRIVAVPVGDWSAAAATGGSLPAGAASALRMLDDPASVSAHDLSPLLGGDEALVQATLVVGAWPELEMAALLWDGDRLAAISSTGDANEQVRSVLGSRRPPLVVGIFGRSAPASIGDLVIDRLELSGSEALSVESGPPSLPRSALPDSGTPVWVRLLGAVEDGRVRAADPATEVEILCRDSSPMTDRGTTPLVIEGIGLGGSSPSLLVPCGGLHVLPVLAAAMPIATPHGRPPSSPPPPVTDHELVAVAERPVVGLLALLLGSALALASLAAVAVRTGAMRRVAAGGRRLFGAAEAEPMTGAQAPSEPGNIPALTVVPAVEETTGTAGRPRGTFP